MDRQLLILVFFAVGVLIGCHGSPGMPPYCQTCLCPIKGMRRLLLTEVAACLERKGETENCPVTLVDCARL